LHYKYKNVEGIDIAHRNHYKPKNDTSIFASVM